MEEKCHCEGPEIWCQGSGGELKVGSPTILRTKACGYLCLLGGCQGSDAEITQAKVSSTLQLQQAGGCHMFSSRLLTWSQSLLPDGSSANGFQVCPWAPGGDILEDTPPPTQVPLLWSPSAAGPGLAWGRCGALAQPHCRWDGYQRYTVSVSDWLLSSEPPPQGHFWSLVPSVHGTQG